MCTQTYHTGASYQAERISVQNKQNKKTLVQLGNGGFRGNPYFQAVYDAPIARSHKGVCVLMKDIGRRLPLVLTSSSYPYPGTTYIRSCSSQHERIQRPQKKKLRFRVTL